MNATPEQWVELGRKLGAHRVAGKLSKRAAAERASISEGWWRNLERGMMRITGMDHDVPVSAKPETVHAAAIAVGMDPTEALGIVGFEPIEMPEARPAQQDQVTLLVADIAAEIRLIREELHRLGVAYEQLAAPPPESPAEVVARARAEARAGRSGSREAQPAARSTL